MNQPAHQDPTLALSLPLSVVNYLITIAGDRPHKESRAVIDLIVAQANNQPVPNKAEPLPGVDAYVAVGATRFSDGNMQTEQSLVNAQIAYLEDERKPIRVG